MSICSKGRKSSHKFVCLISQKYDIHQSKTTFMINSIKEKKKIKCINCVKFGIPKQLIELIK